ncbi:MAG: hypothetical protein E7K18_03225 [Anaerococcus vaginalis]|nr:hypothetical protein [Anaerococcus vaginalis]MDU7649992.1 hypothetical protein [Anaerococcus vaginalis]
MDFIFKIEKFTIMILSMKKIERLRSFSRFLCPNLSMNGVMFYQGS